MSVKHSVGAATLLCETMNLSYVVRVTQRSIYLIHMLAKQDTPMKARSTVLGFVPANARTRVMSTLSMFVLLRADAMVKPPISSMIVGENITEKMYLFGGK